MENVSIVSTELLQTIINKFEDLHKQVTHMNEERNAGLSVWMTTTQLSKYINKSRNWIMTHKHELGCTKKTGTLLFKRSAVDEYLQQDWFRIGEKQEMIIPGRRSAKRK